MEQCLCLFYVLDLFRNRGCECVIKRMRKNIKSNNNDILDDHMPHTRTHIRNCLLFGSTLAQAASYVHKYAREFNTAMRLCSYGFHYNSYCNSCRYSLPDACERALYSCHSLSACAALAGMCCQFSVHRPNFGSAFAYMSTKFNSYDYKICLFVWHIHNTGSSRPTSSPERHIQRSKWKKE